MLQHRLGVAHEPRPMMCASERDRHVGHDAVEVVRGRRDQEDVQYVFRATHSRSSESTTTYRGPSLRSTSLRTSPASAVWMLDGPPRRCLALVSADNSSRPP